MNTAFTTGRMILLWLLCPLVAIASWRFMIGGVSETMSGFLYHAELRPIVFYTHITLAPAALFLVPFQLWPRLRMKRLGLHRILGRVYGLAIFFSGISGFLLAVTTRSGTAAAWGFALLSIAWMAATFYGIAQAMRGNQNLHRCWMIRSMALTMAAVTLRIYLVISELSGVPYEVSAGIIAWLCWVPNLLVAELILQMSNRKRISVARTI
jgi:uncharacterized membrane protein